MSRCTNSNMPNVNNASDHVNTQGAVNVLFFIIDNGLDN